MEVVGERSSKFLRIATLSNLAVEIGLIFEHIGGGDDDDDSTSQAGRGLPFPAGRFGLSSPLNFLLRFGGGLALNESCPLSDEDEQLRSLDSRKGDVCKR